MNNKDITVLYNDKKILAIDKPYGVSVHGGVGIKDALIDLIEKQFDFKPYLVHRLDRDTSGVMIIAKYKSVASQLSDLFKEKSSLSDGYDNKLRKFYWAIVFGNFVSDKGTFTDDLSYKDKVKKALTKYKVLKKVGKFSLIELEIFTGRMHQIRIHLARSGHPIIGDDKYGDFLLNKEIAKKYDAKKLMLFSRKIVLEIEKTIEIIASPPEHFVTFLKRFGQKI